MAGRPSFQSIFRYEIRPLTARCLALTRRSIAYKEKAPTLHRRGRSVTMSCFPLPLFARVSVLTASAWTGQKVPTTELTQSTAIRTNDRESQVVEGRN